MVDRNSFQVQSTLPGFYFNPLPDGVLGNCSSASRRVGSQLRYLAISNLYRAIAMPCFRLGFLKLVLSAFFRRGADVDFALAQTPFFGFAFRPCFKKFQKNPVVISRNCGPMNACSFSKSRLTTTRVAG